MKNDVNKEILTQAVEEMKQIVGSNGISHEFRQMMGWRLEAAISAGDTSLLYGDAMIFDPDYPGDLDVVRDNIVENWIERYGIKELAQKYITTDLADDEEHKAIVAEKRAMIKKWKERAEEILLPYVDKEYARKDIAAMAASNIVDRHCGCYGLILPPISCEEMEGIYKISGLDKFIKEEIEQLK